MYPNVFGLSRKTFVIEKFLILQLIVYLVCKQSHQLIALNSSSGDE